QSAQALRVTGYGRKVAENAERAALSELFGQSEKAFTQSFELVLRQLNPKGFGPSVDIQPTLQMIFSGFFTGFSSRLVKEAQEELARRFRLVKKALGRADLVEKLQLDDGALSQAYGDQHSVAELVGTLNGELEAEPPKA